MTPRASILLALVTAPVAALRYARTVLARALYRAGDACMGAAERVAVAPPPRRRERPSIVLQCEVCGATRELSEWGLGWQDRGGAT